MMHIIEQTHDEKVAMYMKMRKSELAEMLVNANDAIHILAPKKWTFSVLDKHGNRKTITEGVDYA